MSSLNEALARARQHVANSDWAGGLVEAERLLAEADNPVAIGLAAFILFRAGQRTRAIEVLRAAVARFPQDASLAGNLGNALQEAGKSNEAVEWHRRAVALDPGNAGYAINLGITLQTLGQRDAAGDAYEKAVALDPSNDGALRALAGNRADAGDIADARVLFERLIARKPDPATIVRSALMLPPIPPGLDAIPGIRSTFERNIADLKRRNLRIASPSEVGSPSFFLAYHGENEIALQRRIADLYLNLCPALAFVAPHCADPAHRKHDRRIRIGFLSANLRMHTIGRLFGALIGGLDPARFETVLFRRPQQDDAMSQAIDASVARVVPISTELAEAQRQIADCALDIMVYPDIGMDMATFSLAFARLAPVQCVSWGHPLTTGIPTIDYFISWAGAEPDDAAAHYSERLIRLRSFPTCYTRPVFDRRRIDRARFGLPADCRLYLCLQTLFKFHPAFDPALAAILRADPKALIVLIEGPRRRWRALLTERFCRSMPDVADRICFVPSLTNEDYLALTALGDVVLDPPVFGGGNTTLEALAAGRAVVTLPSPYLRGRLTQGMLRHIGRTGTIVPSIEEYSKRAVALARESTPFTGTAPDDAVAALFGQRGTIAEHALFFEAAWNAARSGARLATWP